MPLASEMDTNFIRSQFTVTGEDRCGNKSKYINQNKRNSWLGEVSKAKKKQNKK